MLSFTAASILLTWMVDRRPAYLFIAGGVTLAVVLLLWWAWRREQATTPSPASEYHAIAYFVAFWVAFVVTRDGSRAEAIEWLVLVPPVSFLPLVVRHSVARGRSKTIARRMHLAAGIIFVTSAAFFLLTIIAIVLAPIPLMGAVFHFASARFYREDDAESRSDGART